MERQTLVFVTERETKNTVRFHIQASLAASGRRRALVRAVTADSTPAPNSLRCNGAS